MSTPFKTTRTKKKNLLTLGGHLLTLPKDYKEFSMATYYQDQNDYDYYDCDFYPHETLPMIVGCGAVACAVGHAPTVGIKCYKTEDWSAYSSRTLISSTSDEWAWCFSGSWDHVDNTPQGAGKRIMWLLEKGLPDDWEDQLEGDAALCYTEDKDDSIDN